MEEIKFYGAARGKSGSGKTGVGREGSPEVHTLGGHLDTLRRGQEGEWGGALSRRGVRKRAARGGGSAAPGRRDVGVESSVVASVGRRQSCLPLRRVLGDGTLGERRRVTMPPEPFRSRPSLSGDQHQE